MVKDVDSEIVTKLDQILKVLSMSLVDRLGPEATMTEKARMLRIAGLDIKMIAVVLNTTEASVRTLTSGIRKK